MAFLRSDHVPLVASFLQRVFITPNVRVMTQADLAQYGLRLFAQLNLQLMIVTPLQKIHIIEPFVSNVGFVHNEQGRTSKLRTLSIEEYRAGKEKQ